MPELTDAASRLVVLLERLTSQSPDKSIRTVWAAVFEVDEAATHLVLDRLAHAFQLERDARELVASAVGNDNLELHMRAFNRLERAFSQIHFDSKAQQLLIEARGALDGIRFSADLVARLGSGGTFDTEELAELQSTVEGLIDDVANSDMVQAARDLLVQRLEAVRSAILDIRLRGPSGLEQALDSLYGAVARTKSEVVTQQEGKFLDRFGKILEIGYKIVLLAERLPALVPAAIKLLKERIE